MLAFIRYSTLRLALLLAVGAVAYLFGLRSIALAVVAFLVSGLLSLVLLDRQRDQLGRSVGGLFARINARIDADTRKEDED
ncbi:MAG: DUF4229 domain-containing protein [Candidatus Nanopelagicales bacterium]